MELAQLREEVHNSGPAWRLFSVYLLVSRPIGECVALREQKV